MSVLGSFVQTSTERKKYNIDYSEWLSDGATISAMAFSATPATGSAGVDAYAIDVGSTSVTCYMSGGVSGTQYKVIVQMTDSEGQIKEDEIVLTCRDL